MSDLKDDLNIDKFSLDIEWEKQSQLYLKYSEMLAEYETRRDKLKDLIEVEKAEIEKEIREFPEEYGLKAKPTEGSIKAVVSTDKKIKKMKKKYFQFIKQSKIWGALVKSLDHKKKALENLTQLHLAGYYSTPNHSLNNKYVKENSEEIRKKQNGNLKRNWRKK